MEKFDGKKFYAADERPIGKRDVQVINDGHIVTITETVTKIEWKMTNNYKQYLREKAMAERQHKINLLKHKLQWQYDHYGEVDEIDFQEYMAYVRGIL